MFISQLASYNTLYGLQCHTHENTRSALVFYLSFSLVYKHYGCYAGIFTITSCKGERKVYIVLTTEFSILNYEVEMRRGRSCPFFFFSNLINFPF